MEGVQPGNVVGKEQEEAGGGSPREAFSINKLWTSRDDVLFGERLVVSLSFSFQFI